MTKNIKYEKWCELIGTGKDNVWARGDVGYGQSDFARDRVAYGDLLSVTPSSNNVFVSGSLTGQFSSRTDGSSPSLSKSVMGNFSNQSTMDKLHPNQNFGTVKFDVSKNTRDANKVVNDGNKVSNAASSAKIETQVTRGALKEQHTKDISQATEALKEAAVENGVDGDAAVDGLVADSGASKLGAAALIAGEAFVGGGTFGLMGKGMFFHSELSKQEKGLSADKQEQIIADNLAKLQQQSNPAQIDTRMSAAPSGNAVGLGDSTNHAHWNRLDEQEYEEFLATRFENLEPVQALDQVESDVDSVIGNLQFVAENYGQTGDLVAKGEALAASGQSYVASQEMQEATTLVDAPAVELTGYALGGITRLTFDDADLSGHAEFSSVSEVATKIDMADTTTKVEAGEVNYSALSHVLSGHQTDQMRLMG